jgi:hypothetical protein
LIQPTSDKDGLEKEYLLTVFLSPIHINFKASDEGLNEKTRQLVKEIQEALSGLEDLYIDIEHSVVDKH